MQHLFPAIYATQKSLAEGDLQAYFYEELDTFTLTYIGERTEMYNGKKRLFHLFKLRTAYDDEDIMQNFLAVAGPYEPGTKDKTAIAALTGFYSDEEWTPSKTARLLKAYLEQMKPVEE